MSSRGQVFVYTEIEYPGFPESRPDGLILVVKGGAIRDAAILEMKSGTDPLIEDQIERYIQIAKAFNIKRVITVSNQFVTEPTQSPLNIKSKGVDLYHLSWTYLLTVSRILLFENSNKIADSDQVEIMNEVVEYFEHEKSGVRGFGQMKKGWSHVCDKVRTGSRLKADDLDVDEAVSSEP